MKDFIEQVSMTNAMQTHIISSIDYIEWLYNFTVDYQNFSTDEWKNGVVKWHNYNVDQNINLVSALYTVIDRYYLQNQIASYGHGQYKWYNIKYKDASFLIGMFIGQSAYYFVQRRELTNEDVISFEKIMNELSEVDVDDILYRFSQLETMIKELREMGVSYEELIKLCRNAYK